MPLSETDLAFLKKAGDSGRQLREKLTQILLDKQPDLIFRELSSLGILARILPEVEALHGVGQPPKFHPEGDVFEHTMLMLSHMAWPTSELAWAVLLHDIGKPAARTTGPDGVPHFYGHEALGAVMAEKILTRLDSPEEGKQTVVRAVREHMRFAHVERMRRSRLDKILEDPDFPLHLELNRIDCLSSNGLLGSYVYLLDQFFERRIAAENTPPKCFLSGRDLIRAGLKSGPEFGKILAQCVRLQKEKRLTSRPDALLWLEQTVERNQSATRSGISCL